jgi:glucose-1-phosphatase
MGQNSHYACDRRHARRRVHLLCDYPWDAGLFGCLASKPPRRKRLRQKPTSQRPPKQPTGFSVPVTHYRLEQVVVLSRHNIRSPMSGSGSTLAVANAARVVRLDIQSSELSLRGGALETLMGQYFRQWLEARSHS